MMTIDELRRDDRTSTLRTKYVSGAALPASMISMQAVYDIGRARNARYFIILRAWTNASGDAMSLVGFTRDKNINPQKYFSLEKPLPKDDEHDLVELKQFDWAFKDRQWSLKDLDLPFKNRK